MVQARSLSLLTLLVDHKMTNAVTTSALQAIVSCLTENLFPSALVACFEDYLSALSRLAVESDPEIRKWVCRSIVTLSSNEVILALAFISHLKTQIRFNPGDYRSEQNICNLICQRSVNLCSPAQQSRLIRMWL